MAQHKEMEEFMYEQGIGREQVRLTGSMIDDIMADNVKHFESRRDTLCENLDFDKDKPILLCALPPKILYVFARSQGNFKTYEELVEFWIKAVSEIKSHNVVISLHPAIDRNDVNCAEKYGVKIAEERILDLIPFCDILIGSASSVMYFATACGKPIINYDMYQLKDEYFTKYGMLYVDEKEGFIELLKKLTSDKAFYKKILAVQEEAAGRYGILDGRCGERMVECINDLVKKYNKHDK